MSVRPSPAAALSVVALALLLAAAGAAAALAPAAAQEIDALLARLAASGCQFKRNGSWHDGAAARAHLQRKLDYLKKHDAVASAEQFIERAATRSSVSGEAYWVRCGSAPPQPSAVWLGAQLEALRAAAPPR